MTYTDVLYGREIERLEEVALYRATWPNGNEPDGETTVSITVLCAETEDGIGYILICDDNDCGGTQRDAGDTVYATRETAIATAHAYAGAHDDEAETERYAIGTVNQWGVFEGDTLGNDPDLTTFELLSQAIWEINECIAHSLKTDDPVTNAAIYDTQLDRIVWTQD